MQQDKIKVIISGGGTGGHIFPAIAIANALKRKIQDIEILFVGALGRMEMEKVPAAGYKIVGLNVSGFQRKLTFQNFSVLLKLMDSLKKAKKLIHDFKPDVVVGVGGYASGPILRIATKKGIPTLIQEQNSYPGITNKILAAKVTKICVAYDGMEKFFPKEKIFLTGNPVRQDVIKLEGKKDRALEFFGLEKSKKTVLIVGGSLGARTINEAIYTCLDKFAENNIQLVWQTGKSYYPTAEEAVSKYSDKGIKAFDFITKMDYAYAIADIVVSRAGAIAISEISAVQKPVILIPSPNVAEDHQTKNALALVNHNAAILVKDIEAKEILGDKILELINDEDAQFKLQEKIAPFSHTDADDKIADTIIGLIKNR
jgi:UDP-N-acetylglucosamine--N-acetylmuramyl-(pentapeptide) pyrophosphoryl-undecaprenol N-acetylglucosamine transferase